MSKTAGLVMLQPIGGKIAMPVEIHVETEETWEGYNRANPFAGYTTYSKSQYEILEDHREEIES